MKKLISALALTVVSSIAMASYEDHFPTYFEYCTGTQWKLQTGEVGGTPGHGFVYIHGLCKDYRSSYPQVIPCSEVSPELKKQYPHEGVGVSLDKNFHNVMWVAVPNREFMMFGSLEKQVINKAQVEAQVKKVIELKILDEVISKSAKLKDLKPGTQEYLEAIALDTMGTDHATNWARKLHCVKIPAKKESLPNVTKFLNESNNQYKNGEYIWTKLSNNCVHLSINASNAMGLSKKIEVDQKFIKKLLNLALPANAFLMYADNAVLKKAPSLGKLKSDLAKKDFSITQVGSIMNAYDAFPSGDTFNTDNLTVLTGPRVTKPLKLLATPAKYEAKYMSEENTELKANAEMWITRYEKLIDKLSPRDRGSKLESYLQEKLQLSKEIVSAE